jgi:hypothetical protein
MATVRNRDDGGIKGIPSGVDRNYSEANRNNAGTPVGSVTPQYTGEIVLDTTNRVLWIATGPANTDWMTYTHVS